MQQQEMHVDTLMSRTLQLAQQHITTYVSEQRRVST